jgi:hypothetical protein
MVRQIIGSGCVPQSKEGLIELLREIFSYTNAIKSKGLAGISFAASNEFDRAAGLLDVMVSASDDATEGEKRDGANALFRAAVAGDVDFFDSLAMFMRGVRNGIHDITLALAVKRQFEQKKKRLPTKGEIRAAMTKTGRCGIGPDDNKGWVRLWKDAGLTYLPKQSPHRGKTAHGGDRVTRRQKPPSDASYKPES